MSHCGTTSHECGIMYYMPCEVLHHSCGQMSTEHERNDNWQEKTKILSSTDNMVEMKNVHKILVENLKGRNKSEDLIVDGRII